ncbi:hypothetical protein YTPLAS72_00700 [Nitrospira sp.]|nr:hypothetical protein YTPLAS72_00700 [Nitrospira sp.]
MKIELTERRLTLTGLGLGLLVLVGLFAYATNRGAEQGTQREAFRAIRTVLEHILSLQSYLADAESGQRGFLLTRDASYLSPYHVAIDKIPVVLALLEEETKRDHAQEEQVQAFRILTERKVAELRATLVMVQKSPTEALEFVRSDAGKLLMDDLKLKLKAILEREYELLQGVDQHERAAAAEMFRTVVGATVLALFLIGLGTYRVLRDSNAKEQADLLTAQSHLLNLAPIMTRDVDGRILSWSKGYERLYGWTEDEAIGKISHDLLQTRFGIPPDEIQHTLSSDGNWSGELTHTRHDGKTISVAANWTLLKEGRRRPTAVVEVNTDISELKAAQAAQVQSEARFRLLADHMSQFAWMTDEKGWIYWYNQRWFDYTGTTLSEMQGWGLKKVHHPDHVDRVVEKFTRCIETGDVWEDTFPLRGRDGQYRWFLSRAIPIRDAQGQIIQWFGTNTDITEQHQAEQALTEQTSFIGSILDSLPIHLAVINHAGTILQVNSAWNRFALENLGPCRIEGLGVGVNYLDVLRTAAGSNGEVRKSLDGIEAVLAGASNLFEQEYPCHAPSERRWFRMSVSPLKAGGSGAVITHLDISARKVAEESKAFLAAIVTSSPDAIITKSIEGTILTWNRGAEGLFGYMSSEIVGQPVTALVPEELREEERKLRHRTLSGACVEQFETQRLHKAGRRIDISVTMSPIRDDTGAIVATAQTMRDVTLRKQAEKALQVSEERFRTLTTNIPQLVWSCRPDGACDYLSEQWFLYTGTTIEENLGYGWLSLIHPEDSPVTDQAWKEAVISGLPYSVEYRLRRADGTYHWQLARATPQRDEQGRIVCWFGTTTDISDQKEAETALERFNALLESKSEALAAANKELEAFSYSVSHDLRAPLRTMTGFAEALLEDYGEKLEPEASRYLTIISNGARQMGRLIDDLLSFSRLSRQNLAVTSLSLAELVQEIRDDLTADQAGRTIEWQIEELPACRGDRSTIKLVLANLISNALKYTRPQDLATIRVGWRIDEQQPRHCQIFIKDNGVGFDMRYADKLFTVFQRLHRAEEFEGTGVGLAIVQRIVHRHGGRVGAEGKTGEGATFWFTMEMAL